MWIINVVGAFLSSTGLGVWAIIWCVLNITCLAAVLYVNIVLGLINVLVNFIQLAWFAASLSRPDRVLHLGPGYSGGRR